MGYYSQHNIQWAGTTPAQSEALVAICVSEDVKEAACAKGCYAHGYAKAYDLLDNLEAFTKANPEVSVRYHAIGEDGETADLIVYKGESRQREVGNTVGIGLNGVNAYCESPALYQCGCTIIRIAGGGDVVLHGELTPSEIATIRDIAAAALQRKNKEN